MVVEPLRLKPIFKERVWGGSRLNPDSHAPIGEAWVVYDECLIEDAAWDGATLADLVRECGPDLLGERGMRHSETRFPLLIKLLDAQDWLSVQVHPDDDLARRYGGSNEVGKTEAWYILKADDGASLVTGLSGSPSGEELRAAAEGGTLERWLSYQEVTEGDVIYIPAGRVHAIGPGLLIYEVQQASDITYRLFDWNRPSSAGRELHLDRGVDVVSTATPVPEEPVEYPTLVRCPYFSLDVVEVDDGVVQETTGGQTFHALTVIDGVATLRTAEREMTMTQLETILVPAATKGYEIDARHGRCRILRVSAT